MFTTSCRSLGGGNKLVHWQDAPQPDLAPFMGHVAHENVHGVLPFAEGGGEDKHAQNAKTGSARVAQVKRVQPPAAHHSREDLGDQQTARWPREIHAYVQGCSCSIRPPSRGSAGRRLKRNMPPLASMAKSYRF